MAKKKKFPKLPPVFFSFIRDKSVEILVISAKNFNMNYEDFNRSFFLYKKKSSVESFVICAKTFIRNNGDFNRSYFL